MSGPPSRLRRPQNHASTTSTMAPPPRTHSRMATASTVASSPVTTRSTRHGTVSPSRSRRNREAPQEESNEMNIQVVVRVRGRNEREVKENSAVVVSTPGGLRGKEVALSMGPLALTNKTYSFDRVFGTEADQSQIYDSVVEPILTEVMSGYNCTIFAYGQTGTGKTYTMSGDMEEKFGTFSDNAGIIPRTLHNLFRFLGPDPLDNAVKCSFIELYNEELRDLLANDNSVPVKIFDDSTRKGGVIVQGMEETFIRSAADGVKLLQDGSHKRQVAATKCNDLSSRSHTVFTITIHAKYINDDGEEMMRIGKLNLVDLAGSENIGRSGAENKRAREAGMINQSLLTLGRVINALVDKSQHIPYRESKLTRLLQDSLGGRTKTCIIATISPAKSNLEETMSTLDYASRAKNIRNKPQVNAMLSKKTVLLEYATEIERLKADLKAARTKHGIFLTQETFDELSEENESRRILLEEHERKIELLENQIKKKQLQYENTMKNFMETKEQLHSTTNELAQTKTALEETETDLFQTRTNLKEETAVREAHQKTEKELGTAGRTLISTVKTTTTDIQKLHSKVGRMAELEMQNSTKWFQHEDRVRDTTTEIEDTVSKLTTENFELSNRVAERVQEFVDMSTSKLSQTYASIEERLARFQEEETVLADSTRDGKEKMDSVLEEIKELREDIKSRIGEGLKGLGDAAQRMASDVIADLGLLGEELHGSYSRLRKDVKETMEANRSHLMQQEREIEALKERLDHATATAAQATQSAHEDLDTILASERETQKSERDALIAQIASLINTTAQRQDERLTSRIEGVRSELNTATEKIESATAECQDTFVEIRRSGDTLMSTLTTSQDRILTSLVTDQEAVEKRNAAIHTTANSIHAQTLELVAAQTANIANQMSALDSFVTRARAANSTTYSEFTKNLSAMTAPTTAFLTSNLSAIPPSQDTLADLAANVAADTTQLSQSLEEITPEIVASLTRLRDELPAAKPAEYTPTGETPRKRRYDIVTALPATEPRESIIARLHGLERPPLDDKDVNETPKKVERGIGAAFYPAKHAHSPDVEGEEERGARSVRAKRTKVFDDRDPSASQSLNGVTRRRRA